MKVGTASIALNFHGDQQQHCEDALYAPHYFHDPSPAIPDHNEVLYCMGGPPIDRTDRSLSGKARQVDRVWYSWRKDPSQPWSLPELMLDKFFYPWMNNGESWLAAHLESFASSVCSPSIVKVGARYILTVTAPINDSLCCTGDHPPGGFYGRCDDPELWSFFVLYQAVSLDGKTGWRLVNPLPPNREPASADDHNRWLALNEAMLWSMPEAYNVPGDGIGGFKGISDANTLLADGYFYTLIKYWSRTQEKNGIVRVKQQIESAYSDPAFPYAGHLCNFEIFFNGGTNKWEPCVDGRLPVWMDTEDWLGMIVGCRINQIALAPPNSPKRFIGMLTGGFDGGTSEDQLAVGYSDDLISWTPAELVLGTPPVKNPIIFVDAAGKWQVMYANAGTPPCPQGPYSGQMLWQAAVL